MQGIWSWVLSAVGISTNKAPPATTTTNNRAFNGWDQRIQEDRAKTARQAEVTRQQQVVAQRQRQQKEATSLSYQQRE